MNTRLARVAVCVVVTACARSAAPIAAPVPAPVSAALPPVERPVVVAAVPKAAPLQALVDSLVSLPQFASAQWGVLVVAPERRDTLASVNADKLFLPASNQKLMTGAVALAQLGADYQWRTTFTRTGHMTRGVLHGDLVVTGTGDPSVSVAMRGDPLTAFAPLVAALKRAGVSRIDGRIRTADSPAFPGSPLGYGWDWDDLDAAYGAGVTELMFNEAFTDVLVTGCRSRAAHACVTTTPLATSPVIRSSVTTRTAGSGPPMIEWWRDSARVPGITVRGTIALGDSMTFSAAHPDGRGVYLAAVTKALADSGISVRRINAARSVARDSAIDTVAVLLSLPLRDVLAAMEKPSQNQIAEVVFRTLALLGTGVGTPDSARAVVERQLTAWGVRADARAVRDGSGLSRHDYITPRALVQILDVTRRSAGFQAFFDALPVAGVDGTLSNRMKAFAQGRVHAKTGTIDKARALSGYVTTADGELLIFSIIANNFVVPNRDVDRAAELIVERLVTMRRTTP